MPDGFSEEGDSDTETEVGPDEDVEENSTEEI